MAVRHGTDNSEIIYGADEEWVDDYLYGHGGDDRIYGGCDHDWLTGGAGADYLDGGESGFDFDMAVYADSPVGVMVFLNPGIGLGGTAEGDVLVNIEGLEGSDFDDVLSGDDNTNTLLGGFGNDTLKGGGGYDYLRGNEGDDILWGGANGDSLFGGAGYDTASYEGSSAGVVVSLITNSAAYGDAQGDTFQFIENLTGSDHDDVLIGHNGANVLNGRSGHDTLKGYGADDTLRGESGNDILDGGSGADTMVGGLGNDTYFVDHAGDRVIESGGQGYDVVRTSASHTILTPGADIELLETTDADGTAFVVLYGNSSGNQIIGNNGSNIIDGREGVDQMIGRAGNDYYTVDHASDRVIEIGGQGIDEVYAYVDWILTAGSDVEVLRAGDFNAAINLTGNANGNVVIGSNASNILNGGDGRDELTGLGGQDRYLFNTPLNAPTNVDVITDFVVADDTILLDNAVFSSSLGLGNISAGEFVIGTAAQDANDRIIYDSSTGALFYDNDGVGGNAQVQFAELSRGLALTNLDFLVVTGTQIPSGGGIGPPPVTRGDTAGVAIDDAVTGGQMPVIDLADVRADPTFQDYYVW
jgi:Ca2+-binding RTX toxin-like protein